MLGPYAPLFWLMIFCNVALPQALWSRRVRTNVLFLFLISIVINIGMWLERFVIVVTSLSRDFLPSSWGLYTPTIWDIATFVGTIGLFFAMLFLFIRLLPMISMAEMRELVQETEEGHA
jgi:molybdopterin-containing oxidoreductase family membrane subunit